MLPHIHQLQHMPPALAYPHDAAHERGAQRAGRRHPQLPAPVRAAAGAAQPDHQRPAQGLAAHRSCRSSPPAARSSARRRRHIRRIRHRGRTGGSCRYACCAVRPRAAARPAAPWSATWPPRSCAAHPRPTALPRLWRHRISTAAGGEKLRRQELLQSVVRFLPREVPSTSLLRWRRRLAGGCMWEGGVRAAGSGASEAGTAGSGGQRCARVVGVGPLRRVALWLHVLLRGAPVCRSADAATHSSLLVWQGLAGGPLRRTRGRGECPLLAHPRIVLACPGPRRGRGAPIHFRTRTGGASLSWQTHVPGPRRLYTAIIYAIHYTKLLYTR